MPIIEVDHVTKEFRLGQLRSLKQTAVDALSRLRGRPVPQRAPFKALDDRAPTQARKGVDCSLFQAA